MESDHVPSSEHLKFINYMNSLPAALRPVYKTETPNQSILLYEGNLKIIQNIEEDTILIEGEGTVEYVWFPFPCIQFVFYIKNVHLSIDYNCPAHLTLCNLNTSVEISITNMNVGGSQGSKISGRIKEPIIQATESDLKYLIFHVANFHDFNADIWTQLKTGSETIRSRPNQVIFEVETWKITFEQLETAEDIIKQLKVQGGFGITHIGRIEKLNCDSFSADEAKDFLEMFTNFLSFARGFNIALTLLVGYNDKQEKIWEYWEQSAGDSWRNRLSWFPKHYGGKLAEILPGFLNWWREWEDSAKVALYWYFEANYNPLCEQKIVLVQVALELIAWVLLVEEKAVITSTRFNKLPASDKLRLLLSQFAISLKIPPQPMHSVSSNTLVSKFVETPDPLKDLVQLAKSNNWIDGLHAFTEMRNGIVHPKTKKRQKIYQAPSNAKFDTSELGLWYLELVFLAMFDYQGDYTNRLLRNGQTESVPWCRKS